MRREADRLAGQRFDVVVIGGGILGAFVAWDSALRGLRTGLIERHDFASGTTSASGRVLHGGLRSLQYLEAVDAVESMREQARVASLVPDLVTPLPFLFPTGPGLTDQALLRLAAPTWKALPRALGYQRDLPSPRFHSSPKTLDPELREWAPRGGLVVWDLQIRSPERLVIAVLQAAAEAGAAIANRIEALEVLESDGKVTGLSALDLESGAELTIRAGAILNAAGPWASHLWDERTRQRHPIGFARGVHLVTDLPGPPAALGLNWRDEGSSEQAGRARRMFAFPFEGSAMIGASWTPVPAAPGTDLEPGADEVRDFATSLGKRWPALGLRQDRIRFATVGLYPMFGDVRRAAESFAASRRPLVIDHGAEGGPRGLVTAVSAKLTTARALAERLVDGFARRALANGSRIAECGTTVAGALEAPAEAMAGPGDSSGGSDAMFQVGVASAADEMARSLEDVVLRRRTLGLHGPAAREVLQSLAQGAGSVLGWNEEQIRREIDDTEQLYRRIGINVDGGEA